MGRKGKKWLGAVKKVFSHDSKENEKSHKSKKKWGFGKSKHPDLDVEEPPSSIGNSAPLENAGRAAPAVVATVPRPEDVKLVAENEQSNKHDNAVAMAAVAVAEASVAARAIAEVAPLNVPARFTGKSREESAAIKIQTAFRCHMARRALRALRGLVRLKAMVESNSVKRQAATTLRCMQTLARVQSQIRSRRIRMAEENQALQRQLLLNREKELEKLRMGEWDDSLQSKEQIELSMLSKHEASIRRERALAYAFSHQWKSSSKNANPLFTDPNNPHWGWSWLERWMAARPWETKNTTEKETSNNDQSSVKSAAATRSSVGGEITKAYARRDTNPDQPSPAAQKRQSFGTPSSKPAASRIKSASVKGAWAPAVSMDDDSKSLGSLQSERPRRHSIAGSSVGDDESLASSPAVPSYMAQTESARAKSRFQSATTTPEKAETPEKAAGPPGSAKKRLSFPAGGGAAPPVITRRHSGPPKVDVPAVKDVAVST